MVRKLVSASVLVVLVYAMASGANAFTADKRTYFTFSESVVLPGVTLPAGTYMFRLADPDTSRRVIQVANKQGTQSYAQLHTMPLSRTDRAKDSEIEFLETPAGAPRAVNAWWYMGDTIGYQFMYSKQQLAELNRVPAPEPVAASREEAPGRGVEAEVEAADVPPLEDPVRSPDVVEGDGIPSPDDEEADVRLEAQAQQAQSQPPAAPPAEPSESSVDARERLPETAGQFASVILGGLIATLVGMRLIRKS